jgi:LPXTG-motif cell wall-anchored protein
MRKLMIVMSIIVTLLLGIATVRTVAYADNSDSHATLTVKENRPSTPSGNTTPPASDGHGSLPDTDGNTVNDDNSKSGSVDDGKKIYYANSLPGTNGKKYARSYEYHTNTDMHELPQTGEGDALPAQLAGVAVLLMSSMALGWQISRRRRVRA